jgi:hypothetical protein
MEAATKGPPYSDLSSPRIRLQLARKFVYHLRGKKATLTSVPDDMSASAFDKARANKHYVDG